MALNEHDPSGPSIVGERVAPTDAESATATDAARAAELVARAQDAVVAGDVTSLADALAQNADLTDMHRRHQARLRSVEQVLLPRPRLVPATLARLMLVTVDALIPWLEATPAEPTLLGYAGVLSSELGLYKEAEALFGAALRLEPAREDHQASLAAVRARRKAGAKVVGLPGDVRHALPSRRPRLSAIAAAARPADGLRVSLCMIVRDEEEWLGRCLAAAQDGVDEMIIVDTGSRDRTVEIAESFGATVLHYPWTGHFSDARNVGLNAATGDWLLWLDADEIFADGEAIKVRDLARKTWRECYRMDMVHFLGDADDGERAMHAAWRMCRNRPEYRFKDRVHEQIAHAFPGFLHGERLTHAPLRINHYGYLGEVRTDRAKSDRNLTLLLGQLEDGDDTAFMHFNLGSEYSVIGTEEAQRSALEHFRIAYGKVTGNLDFRIQGFLPALLLRYVRALRGAEAWGELDEVCEVIHANLPGFTDVIYEQGLAAYDQRDWETARARFEACLNLGDAPAIYSPTLGCGSHLAELRLAHIDLQEQQVDEAIERFRKVRAEHPEYLGLVDPYATVLLAEGRTPAQVLEALTAGHDLSPSGWFMVGVNFQERGHVAQAQEAFRGALERRPTFDQARVALADSLLVQGRIHEALEAVDGVPPDVRVGGAALRTAIFARLVLEDPALDDQLAELIAQLSATSLPELTQDALRAWASRRLGLTPPSLTRHHVDELTPLMDAALRLGAADAFAELVDVLATTGIERRAQHEVLATLFLVRGLTELAADAWIAAADECGVDAAAYAGLAEVARLQGMPDDARTLASEALQLDPSHRLAQAVLDQLDA